MTAKYFIDYVAQDTSAPSGWRGLGFQMLEELPPGRTTASEGREDFTLTENITLQRGHTEVVVKASKAKPVTGYTIIYPYQGVRTWVHPLDPAR